MNQGASETGVLVARVLAAVAMLSLTFVSDRLGRKPIMIVGIAATMLFVYPMLMLVLPAQSPVSPSRSLSGKASNG